MKFGSLEVFATTKSGGLESEDYRHYQNLVDVIPQIIFRASAAGTICYFNHYWQKYTGMSSVESTGGSWVSAIYPADLIALESEWTRNLANKKLFESKCRIKNIKTGDFCWHLLRVAPEFNDAELVGWIGVVTDIQDQKTIQEELLLSKTLADSANETKSRFLANISHEIRTPLGIILGFSELLMDINTTPQEKIELISKIRKNGHQLSKIIDEILDLSKFESKKMNIEKSEVSVIDFFDGIKTFMSLAAKENGIDLDIQLQGKIPSKIYSSSARLQQILVNLIGNGIKFSPKGKVVVTLWHKAPFLYAGIKDTGPGLTAAQIDQLFQPFTQVDTSMTRKHGGTGLGLALSRKLARAMGGDLIVNESPPGEGCNFILSIETGSLKNPFFISSLELQKLPSDSMEYKSNAHLRGMNVLLVEDSPDNQFLVKRFLTMEGATVDIANNGIEGVEKAMGHIHDIVLMDIQMPELDGYGAISQLRQQGYKKPIIALTAHGMMEERQRCLDIGSNDHLTKPVNRVALIKRIKELHIESQEAVS